MVHALVAAKQLPAFLSVPYATDTEGRVFVACVASDIIAAGTYQSFARVRVIGFIGAPEVRVFAGEVELPEASSPAAEGDIEPARAACLDCVPEAGATPETC